MKNPIWALSGFLGLKSDWDLFKIENLKAFDFFDFEWENLNEWGKKFNELHASRSSIKPVLMGYSLGGRLALHALIDNPSLYQAAIIISAHPGLKNEEEHLSRIQSDGKWAQHFENEEWHNLMTAWNNQLVFKKDEFHFERAEKNYSRDQLAYILRKASLGSQTNLDNQIAQIETLPILWINGEEDEKFCKAAHSIQLTHPLSQKVTIPKVGHRMPWKYPEVFKKLIHDFLLK